jgi:hypothetical protein
LVASSGSLLAGSGELAAVDVLAFAMFDAAVACDVDPDLESLSQAAKDAASSTAQNIFLVLSFFSFVVCGRRPLADASPYEASLPHEPGILVCRDSTDT